MRYNHKHVYNDYNNIDVNNLEDRALLVHKLLNKMTLCGNKFKAEGVFLKSLCLIRKKLKGDPLKSVCSVILQACPFVELKTRRVGSVNRQIPVTIHPKRQASLAIRWIVENARKRKEKTFEERLAMEIVDTALNRSVTSQKRDSNTKMAEANRAFAHYRW
jgi:small subunit ribosomal protein S7